MNGTRMSHVALAIQCPDLNTKEVLLAQLALLGFDGFEEQGHQLLAYQPHDQFNELEVRQWLEQGGYVYSIQFIEEQNWNALWESNFEPVMVGDFCAIRADFHEALNRTQYEIVITPKMSFGTGHHATTHLMIQAMQGLVINGKMVFDFGTGTGVLAILAQQMGAARVEAMDNDPWSIENAKENLSRNHCSEISLFQGETIPVDRRYDLILANINRHILLQEMQSMRTSLSEHGQLLMSGLLVSDQDIVAEAAQQAGLVFQGRLERDSWICLHYSLKP